MSSITEQIHDNCALSDGLVNVEEICAWYPSILLSFFPGSAILSDTDDHVQAIVTQIETLTVTLRAVTDEGESVVLEIFLFRICQISVQANEVVILTRSLSCGQSSRSLIDVSES